MRSSKKNKRLYAMLNSCLAARHSPTLHLIALFILALGVIQLLQIAPTKKALIQASTAPSIARAALSEGVSVHASEQSNSSIKFSDGHDVLTAYRGEARLQQALHQGQAQPLALASADFDEDGVPDLVCGYTSADSSLISLHRGNLEAIYPPSLAAQQRPLDGSPSASPFLSAAQIFAVPEAADLLGVGDFDADGHWDLVSAARYANQLYFFKGNGNGEFQEARSIALSGKITALLSGEINRRDGLDDLVVGINSPYGAKALIFEGPRGALRAEPEIFALSAAATSLALGQIADDYSTDLAITAGHELLILHGRDRKLSLNKTQQALVQTPLMSKREFQTTLRAVAIGDFSGKPFQEIALLSEEGNIQILSPGESETTGNHADAELARWNSKIVVQGLNAAVKQLVTARLASLPLDSLVIADATAHQVQIVTNRIEVSGAKGWAATSSAEALRNRFVVEGEVSAVLPMRMNADALSDLVVLKSGGSPLAIVTTQAQATFTVTNINDQGAGSFRQAILDANANPGADTINFQIAGSAVPTILPLSPLPDFTEPVTIDGTTQTAGRVELSGAQTQYPDPLPDGRLVTPLRIKGGNSTVRGLVINRFFWEKVEGVSTRRSGGCIYLAEHGNNIIEGNFLGVDSSGTKWFDKITCVSTFPGTGNNLIGGTTVAARNVIFGTLSLLYNGNNKVQGNLLGTNANGTAHLMNDNLPVGSTELITTGMVISSPGNVIGGPLAGARNIISIQNSVGIILVDSLAGPESPAAPHKTVGNLIQGNYIGTNIFGTLPLGLRTGISNQNASDTTIGGTTPSARNIVSACQRIGIDVVSSQDSAGGTLIQGNYIGTDHTGMVALGNSTGGVPANEDTPYRPLSGGVRANVGYAGFAITPTGKDIIIGGALAEARNVISGSRTHGVALFGTVTVEAGRKGIQVQGNYIGTDASGTQPIGNKADGIFIGSQASQYKIEDNLIAFNEGNGINIPEPFNDLPGAKITIRSNAIYSNQLLGIDIGNSGITNNDSLDADMGANNLQNFPVLVAATSSNTSVNINGEINSAANTTYTLQFFVGSNHQGHQLTGATPVLLGERQLTTDGNGNASFVLTFAATGDATGKWLNATATDATGNTSEFSDCLNITRSNCTYSFALASQTFKAGGGTGSINVTAGSDCNWTASSKADWLTLTSSASSKGNGAVNYSVAAYTGVEPRTGVLTIAEQTFTVTQTGIGPVITNVAIQGKHLIVTGENFDSGAVILLDGERQKTIRDEADLTTLRGKKVALKIPHGVMVKIQVRNSNEIVSPIFDFRRPTG